MLTTAMGPDRKRFKFGRKHAKAPCPQLAFGNYLLKKFPASPPEIDYTPKARAYLKDIYGNDICGDCTCAAIYHCKATILANSNRPVPYSGDNVTDFYEELSGWNGVEGDPSDTGLDCETVLNYVQNRGLIPDGDRIYAWMAIDATSQPEVQAALDLFVCLYFGIDMPGDWVARMQDLQDGDVWDVAGPGLPQYGHSFMGAHYDEEGVHIDTWGLDILLRWAAVAKYASGNGGSLYCMLDQEMIDAATQKAPSGVNWTQLISDFQSMGGALLRRRTAFLD